MNLYDVAETGTDVVFSLKDRVLETDLLPFLESMFSLLFNGSGGADQLKRLHSTPTAEWIGVSGESDAIFQMDNYGSSCFFLVTCDY